MSYTKDDFYCPVCQEELKTPVWTVACQHVFYLENIMRTFSGSCRCCAKQIKFYRMRHHYKSGKKYQDEYGVSSIIPTFKCPSCQESNFTGQRLRDHCNSNHLFQIVPVTCPICVSLPWGDPSQVTRNFVGHLNQRHQFDYGEFVNLQLDEETLYQTSVKESFQVNI
ncbi:hypothetical protein FD754_023258 [Muntiacus muntjak]|uniref:RING-type E3 ubiquitin transferase n=1 Tax=Muntiacus muntjak TaxID=9888 RepID=A0A5N3UUT3_MUNMU|nr:hypothetical protein FD754_023258 [Muntiacus muntjak]